MAMPLNLLKNRHKLLRTLLYPKKTIFFHILFLISLSACAPLKHPAGIAVSSCQITADHYITEDNTKIPLRTWHPSSQQKYNAVIIAIHGFNDYSYFFQLAGNYFNRHNIISYAYDQRGFGNTPNRGLWAGTETYIDDLHCFIELIKEKHGDIPIYLLGESMGAAIVISTVAEHPQLPITGIILSAPAVWGRETMPWYQNTLLWTLSHSLPWLTLTGSDLKIQASDNIDMLIALGKDPLVIKETRVESIYGLVNLMDQALTSAKLIELNTLLLYGEKDQIIPKLATQQFLNHIKSNPKQSHTIAYYKNGYHLLLRDLQAPILWQDIVTWMDSPDTPLPSGADKRINKLFSSQ